MGPEQERRDDVPVRQSATSRRPAPGPGRERSVRRGEAVRCGTGREDFAFGTRYYSQLNELGRAEGYLRVTETVCILATC